MGKYDMMNIIYLIYRYIYIQYIMSYVMSRYPRVFYYYFIVQTTDT